MIVKLLTEQHLEFLSVTEGCTGLSETTLVKMPHCWKSHVTAQLLCVNYQVSEMNYLKFHDNYFVFAVDKMNKFEVIHRE